MSSSCMCTIRCKFPVGLKRGPANCHHEMMISTTCLKHAAAMIFVPVTSISKVCLVTSEVYFAQVT